MSTVMIWPAGGPDDGTSQYRLYLPAKVLQDDGYDVKVDRTTGPWVLWDKDWRDMPEPPPDTKVVGLVRKPNADTIVIQRPGRRWWADVIPMLQEKGVRVVVDIDDHFAKIEKDNAAYDAFHGGDPANLAHHHTWVAEACKRADLVTVTTPVLLAAYGFGHGRIIPNYVPASYLDIDQEHMEETAVWTGTMRSHPHDLGAARGGIGEALKAEGWGFHVVGEPTGVQGALKLKERPSFTGWIPFEKYPYAMAEATIGVVPLADTVFNAGKSCLKLMEFSALGVPALGSPTPDNIRLAKLGIGEVVSNNSKNQWRTGMRRLMRSQDYRDEVAGRSRGAMAEYTYEKQAWQWADAWGVS